MVIAGLTGGIATGKSTVAAFLGQAGAVIVDADRIAHDVVRRGFPAWQGIVDRFGRGILRKDGEIDREKLGRIIFHDTDSRNALNRIVHPFVFEGMAHQVDQIRHVDPSAVVIQDIPLLFESGMQRRIPVVIVVYLPESLQFARLMKRNHLSEADAAARIRSQIPIEEKKKMADILIDNSGTIEETRALCLKVYETLNKRQ